MSYRVAFWLIPAVLIVPFWVALGLISDSTSAWEIAPVLLVFLFFPKEWLAEKISGQPRVYPWKRRRNAAER